MLQRRRYLELKKEASIKNRECYTRITTLQGRRESNSLNRKEATTQKIENVRAPMEKDIFSHSPGAARCNTIYTPIDNEVGIAQADPSVDGSAPYSKPFICSSVGKVQEAILLFFNPRIRQWYLGNYP